MTWTLERRLRQSHLIHNWKPWNLSTGAKSPEGKARSSKNATKNGDSLQVRELMKQVNRLLREHRKLLT